MGKKEIDYMDERLKKQLDFALEIDKEKNILRQTHFIRSRKKKMTQNMRGIWRSWPIFYGSIPMSLLILPESCLCV